MEHTQAVHHTIQIFERLCRDIPPLVPAELQKDMSNALEQLQDNVSLTLEEVEQTMVVFAKKLWPYREAFLEFYRVNEGNFGETFLLQKLSVPMKKKYQLFKAAGGTFRDLHSGGEAVNLFDAEERSKLCEVLVDLHHELWDFTKQEALTKHRKEYLEKIHEFEAIFTEVERQLEDLRVMADKEQEHPTLAAEIRSHVEGFEHSMAVLGPRFDYDALCSAREYFNERKAYKVLKRHAA